MNTLNFFKKRPLKWLAGCQYNPIETNERTHSFRKRPLKWLVIGLIKTLNNWMCFVALLLLQIYKHHISSAFSLGGSCRFYPSCSDYAIQTYQKHSFLKAGQLTLFRLLSCHPFSSLWTHRQKRKRFFQRDWKTLFLRMLNKKK